MFFNYRTDIEIYFELSWKKKFTFTCSVVEVIRGLVKRQAGLSVLFLLFMKINCASSIQEVLHFKLSSGVSISKPLLSCACFINHGAPGILLVLDGARNGSLLRNWNRT